MAGEAPRKKRLKRSFALQPSKCRTKLAGAADELPLASGPTPPMPYRVPVPAESSRTMSWSVVRQAVLVWFPL